MDNTEKNTEKTKMTDFFVVSIILSMSGGLFDSYSYLCRDKVFANAQTGNMVLLAVNAIELNFKSVLLYFCPIFAFTLGILLSEIMKEKFKDHPKIHWHQLIVLFEIVIVAIIGFIPIGELNSLANILISFSCAMQYQCFKRIEGKPYASTMCTGNLRSATVNFFRYCVSRNKDNLKTSSKYITSIIFFIIGAGIGGLLVPVFKEKAIFVNIAHLLMVLVFLIHGERTQKK